MKNSFALIALLLLSIPSAHAQTSPGSSQQATMHRAPGTAAPSVSPSSDAAATPSSQEKSALTVSPDEDKAIRHLMQLLGTDKMAESFNQSITIQLRDAMTKRGMSEDQLKQFLQDFGQNFAAQSVDSKVNTALVQVFAAHLSAQDINGLVQFYESPLGNRFMDALPYISQSSQQEGIKIVREQAIAVLRQMSDQYPEVKTMLPPESSTPSGSSPPVQTIPDQAPHLGSSPSPNPSTAPQN